MVGEGEGGHEGLGHPLGGTMRDAEFSANFLEADTPSARRCKAGGADEILRFEERTFSEPDSF